MGRKKAAQNCKILPWLSARADNREGRFLQVGNSLLLDKTYQRLSGGAKHLLLCLHMEAGGKNKTKFSHGTARKYGIASTSFDRQVRELMDGGFITIEYDPERSQFKTNVYCFDISWKTKTAPQNGE